MTSIWEIESLVRLKDKLRGILSDRGVTSEDGDNLNTLVEKVNQINNDTILNQMLSEGVENFYNDKITKLVPYALAYSKNITESIELPNVTEAGSYAFYYSAAKIIKLPKLYRSEANLFMYSSAEELYLNNAAIMGFQSYTYLTQLRKLYAPKIGLMFNAFSTQTTKLTHICYLNGTSNKDFSSSEKLEMMIITQKSAVSPFSTASYIPKKALTDGNCYIYVPSALLTNYKTATNISVYADRIRAIEDYMTEICAEFPDFENDYAQIE